MSGPANSTTQQLSTSPPDFTLDSEHSQKLFTASLLQDGLQRHGPVSGHDADASIRGGVLLPGEVAPSENFGVRLLLTPLRALSRLAMTTTGGAESSAQPT